MHIKTCLQGVPAIIRFSEVSFFICQSDRVDVETTALHSAPIREISFSARL